MIYDRRSGMALAVKYLVDIRFKRKLLHSFGVGEFAYSVANRILKKFPAIGELDAERAGFLGYVHDIGVSRSFLRHEIPGIELLVEEGIKPSLARKIMHGQVEEQYGNGDGKLLPVGIEGIILTYADMSFNTSRMSIEERLADIKERVGKVKDAAEEWKRDVIVNIDKAYPRYKRYERIVFLLSGANSFSDF